MAVSCSTYQNIGSTVLPVRDKFLFLLLVEIVTDYRDAPIRFRKKCVVDVEQRGGEKEAGREKEGEIEKGRRKKERWWEIVWTWDRDAATTDILELYGNRSLYSILIDVLNSMSHLQIDDIKSCCWRRRHILHPKLSFICPLSVFYANACVGDGL